MARLGPDDGAQEGAAALPDRQARDPPQRAGQHPHAPCLARRRRQRARHPRGGRLARRAVAARGAGGAPPRTRVRGPGRRRSEEHTSELQSLTNLVCRLLLEKKKKKNTQNLFKKKKQKNKKKK